MAYHFKNLVFEGGGVKGIAYVGAMKVFREEGILENIDRVGGASAGAINAALLGLGFSYKEMKDILWKLDFNNFMDDSWGYVRDTKRLVEEYGWYKGDFFRDWIGQRIREKTGNSESTFADIEALKEDNEEFRSMYFIGTNLSTRFSEKFSFEHTPRMCIADAVRRSMSIPLFFAAVRGNRGDVYVDGGMLNNYPVKLFDRKRYLGKESNGRSTGYYDKENEKLTGLDRPVEPYLYNKETLGFRLDTKEEISIYRDQAEPVHNKIDDFFDYTWSLVKTLLAAQASIHLHSDDWARTVYIDTADVKTTDFDLSNGKKKELVANGEAGAKAYLDWYNSAKKKDAPNK